MPVTYVPGGIDTAVDSFLKAFTAARGFAVQNELLELRKDEAAYQRKKDELELAKTRVALVGQALPEGTTYVEMTQQFPWLEEDVNTVFGKGASAQMTNLPVRAKTVAGQVEQLGLNWLEGLDPSELGELGERAAVRGVTGESGTLGQLALQDMVTGVMTDGYRAIMDHPQYGRVAYTIARKDAGLDEEMVLTDPTTGEEVGRFDTVASFNAYNSYLEWQARLAADQGTEAAKALDQLVSNTVSQINKHELTIGDQQVKNMYLWNEQTVVVNGQEYNALDVYAAQNWGDQGVRVTYGLIKGQIQPTAASAANLSLLSAPGVDPNIAAALMIDKQLGLAENFPQDERLEGMRQGLNALFPGAGLGDAAFKRGRSFFNPLGETSFRQPQGGQEGGLPAGVAFPGPQIGGAIGMFNQDFLGALTGQPAGVGAIPPSPIPEITAQVTGQPQGTPMGVGGTPFSFQSLPEDQQIQTMASMLRDRRTTPTALREEGIDPKLITRALDQSRQNGEGGPRRTKDIGIGPITIRTNMTVRGLAGLYGRTVVQSARALTKELAGTIPELAGIQVNVEHAGERPSPMSPTAPPPAVAGRDVTRPTPPPEREALPRPQRRGLDREIEQVKQRYNVEDPDLAWLIAVESSGKPTAQNPDSTAFGLGQLIVSNRVAYGRRLGINPNTVNPNEQVRMMEEYIRERYGSPEAARRFHELNGWY